MGNRKSQILNFDPEPKEVVVLGKTYYPEQKLSLINNPMNPNTIFPLFRETNKIMNNRIVEGAKITKTNFLFKKIIGKGKYGSIWQVERLPDREQMVIKEMEKVKVYRMRAVDTILNEKRLMSELMHPFLASMRYAF